VLEYIKIIRMDNASTFQPRICKCKELKLQYMSSTEKHHFEICTKERDFDAIYA